MLDPAPLDSLDDLAAALVTDQTAYCITRRLIHHRQGTRLAIGRIAMEGVREDHIAELPGLRSRSTLCCDWSLSG